MSTSAYKRGLVSIILSTYNERDNILETIGNIFHHVPEPLEIIVVDDDSPDRTWKLVDDLNDPRVKLIRRVGARGLASAFMRGIIESQGDIIGWLDADMCMPPRILPEMIEKLGQHDVVIGSRYADGGEDLRHPLRVYASRLINALATFILGYGIKDYDSGFVVLRRSVFDKVLPTPKGYGEYFIEFIYRCCKKRLRVCEIGYSFIDRQKGVSKSFPSLLGFFSLGTKYVLRIIRTRFERID